MTHRVLLPLQYLVLAFSEVFPGFYLDTTEDFCFPLAVWELVLTLFYISSCGEKEKYWKPFLQNLDSNVANL